MQTDLYMGLDLSDSFAQVSFWKKGEELPVTVSTRKDEDHFRIPTSLYIGNGGYYLYGEEAEKKRNSENGEFYDQLYLRAMDMSETDGAVEAVQRLSIFVRRLIRLREVIYPQKEEMNIHLCITVPELTVQAVIALRMLAKELEDYAKDVRWMDYEESFYCYAYHQDPSIWAHDVALFDFEERRIRFILLARDTRKTPQVVRSGRDIWEVPEETVSDQKNMDRFFADVLREAFAKRIISGVYMIGSGFHSPWMQESAKVFGPNRRAFIGDSLYTKGAAYGAADCEKTQDLIYEGSYKVNADAYFEARVDGTIKRLPVVKSGENWFDQRREYTVLLKGDPSAVLCIRKRLKRSEEKKVLQMEDIWNRPEKTRRIHISAKMTDVQTLTIAVRDTGFGNFYSELPQFWNFTVKI